MSETKNGKPSLQSKVKDTIEKFEKNARAQSEACPNRQT
jgi:hypothetical protein